MASDEKRLVMEARSGSADAFDRLVRLHRDEILNSLTTVTGDREMAEDVVQEAFLTAFKRLSSLGPPFRFGAWVWRISLNRARNLLTRSRRPLPLDSSRLPADGAGDRSGKPDTVRVSLALDAMSRLTPKLRETARLYYMSGIRQKGIARRMGIPVGTVKRRLWEGRSRMRREIESAEGRAGRTDLSRVPEIEVVDLPGESMDVELAGPGLYFGTELREGHREKCRFYDYPGGILTSLVETSVVRRLEIQGEVQWEVLVHHSECEPPEPNVLDYFRRVPEGFLWTMRVIADGSYPDVKAKGELFPGRFSSTGGEDYSARVVDLTVGDRPVERCVAVFWGMQSGTPAEGFFGSDGRQLLHRRYVAEEAPDSEHYDYEKLRGVPVRECDGSLYRLWYETVLDRG